MTLPTAATEAFDRKTLEGRQPSVGHLFRHRVRESGSKPAYQYFVGEDLEEVTWDQAWDRVSQWSAGLVALGLAPEDRVAIISHTRFEWVLADLAIMCSGGATTTVYPNTIAEDVAYLLGDSGCKVVFAEDAEQVAKVRSDDAVAGQVTRVVCFDASAADGEWVISTDQLAAMGAELLATDGDVVDSRIEALTPDSLATIIYTSGTTGRPKGVELTHEAFVWAAASASSAGLVSKDDLQFLWLPLAHVFGKVLLSIPMQVGFPTAVDGRIDRIVDNLPIIKPTIMGAAPRIFEKVKAKVGMTLAEETGVKAKLIAWAFEVGAEVARRLEAGESIPAGLKIKHAIADKLVLSKVRDRFGGRMRLFISGSAPLDADVARWFAAVGLLVAEGYGLTETTAFTTVNRNKPGTYQFGSIGWPAPGTEVRIADDGEVLVRGPGVMRGYHNKPEATAEVLTQDGWFHTGDIGEIDERGFVRITDRKKDFFKTSGGKYIAPSRIEATFKGLCPYVSQFVVLGEGKNYAAAMVTLDEEAITAWADQNGKPGLSYEQIVTSKEAHEMVQHYVDQLNAGLNRWETIKRFVILERDVTLENDELTPSMKLKRKTVIANFQEQADSLYDA